MQKRKIIIILIIISTFLSLILAGKLCNFSTGDNKFSESATTFGGKSLLGENPRLQIRNESGDEVAYIGHLGNIYGIGNITTEQYFLGQPLEGYLGSGIIWAEEVDANGNLNVSHVSGLDVNYPGFVMRLVKTDNSVKYCNITGNTVTVPDDTHSVYYIDSSCNVQHTSIQNYIETDLSPGGLADFFNVVSDSGSIGILEGSGLMNKEDIKIRKNTFKLTNLDVVSGLSLMQEGFPNISIEEGEYSYINEIFDASSQNTSNGDTIALLYRQGGSWTHESQTGLNLTWCDDGTDSAACTNTNKYRRYYIGIVGRNASTDTTRLHQIAASETETYNNLGDCLDIASNSITFSLPENHEYVFVLLYAYCGRASDTGWTGSFIDLRTTKTEVASGVPDLSIYLTRDGSRTLTDNWNVGNFNITVQDLNVTNEIYIKDKKVYDWLYNMTLEAINWVLSKKYINSTNVAYINKTNTFAEQQVFNKGINITGEIRRPGVNTTTYLTGTGNLVTKFGEP